MKKRLFGSMLLFVGILFVQNNYAQDHTRLSLPDGVIARLSKGFIFDIAYSDDGTRLAVGSSIGVWVYNAHTGAQIDILTDHASLVRSVAFNPDGSMLASGNWDGIIHLWDANTRQHLHTLTGHTSAVNSIAFSWNGTLASSSQDIIRLWDAATGQHLRGLTPRDRFGRERINSVAFSPDGSTLASAGHSHLSAVIDLWDVTTGQYKSTLSRNLFGPNFNPEIAFMAPTDYYSVAFSPDGSTLASTGKSLPGDIIDLWDVTTEQYRSTLSRNLSGPNNLPGPNLPENIDFYSYYSVAFDPDGTLASGGEKFFREGIIDLWDPATGQHQQRLTGHTGPVRKVAFIQDGRFASGGGEELLLWDATGLPLDTITGHKWLGRSVAFSANGTLASGGWVGSLDLWDADTGQHEMRLSGHGSVVNSIAFSPDGKTLASVAGKIIRLWDTATGQYKSTLPDRSDGQSSGFASGHGIGVGGIGFGDTSGGLTGIRLGGLTFGLDFGGGSGGSDPYKNDPFIFSVAFSRDGSLLAAGTGRDHVLASIDFRDATTGELLNRIAGLEADVWSVAFSPDGTLASGSTDGVIRLWNVTSEQPLKTFEGHTSAVWSVAFNSDGRTLASADADGIIRLWNVTTGRLKQTLEGHADDVRSIAFSPDDRILASGSLDRTIRLWDAVTGQPEQTLEGHLSEVWSVAFSQDGSILASGSLDGTVLLWDMSPYITIQSQTPSPDFDGNGIVDISDFLLFAEQFGLSRGDAGYDARYDLDGDGTIGIGDFLIFVNAFGEKTS